MQVGTRLGELWDALRGIREVKQQLRGVGRLLRGHAEAAELMGMGRRLSEQLTAIEGEITQLEGEGGQDALNFPGRLDNQWAVLYSAVANPDTPVTAGARQRFEDLQPQTDELLARLDALYEGPLRELNDRIAALQVDVIPVPRRRGGGEQAAPAP